MTEKQKMLLGIMYHADDEALIAERTAAKKLTYQYNQLQIDNKEQRKKIIKQLIGKTGKNFHLESPLYFDYGYRTQIGENFFSNFNLTILDGGGVTIGSNVYIAPNVNIYTAQHPTDIKRRNMGLEWALPVTIGDNVTIGAGSVVTKDIPSGVVAAGNPCKEIRKI